MDLERTTALKRPLGIVFVTLVSLAAAKKVYSDHQQYACSASPPISSVSRRLKPHKWKVQFAPSPRDICWCVNISNVWKCVFVVVAVVVRKLSVLEGSLNMDKNCLLVDLSP